jgi:oligopeptide/dipeptide ABC transporter ATP-binding protein
MTEPLLEVEHLSVDLRVPGRDLTLVDDVSFTIARGETLCLVGESGCGKSLTARAVLRLTDPPLALRPGSRVVLDGRDLAGLSERAMRDVRGRDVAMIFQDPMSSLNPVYTIGNQMAESVMLHRGLSRAEARDRTIELFRLVGLSSPERRIDQFPHELSGGMQQRVMIAMALSCDPALLIADEPTTALDVTIQAQILDLLRELQARLDMGLLLITHDLGVVAEMATDVAVMYAGAIVETGTVAEVLHAPRHPYTQALLGSIPRFGTARDQRLAAIGGIVPSPWDWPLGCRFAPRCAHAFDRCVREEPGLGARGGHRAACFLVSDAHAHAEAS